MYQIHIYYEKSGIFIKYFGQGQRFRGNLVTRFPVIIPPSPVPALPSDPNQSLTGFVPELSLVVPALLISNIHPSPGLIRVTVFKPSGKLCHVV